MIASAVPPIPVAAIPRELRDRPHWLVWRYEQAPGSTRPTKVPYQASRPDRHAASTRPATWTTFDAAVAALARARDLDGIGYVLADDDPYTGVDLDHCRDAATGEIADWAQDIIDRLASYTEVSPSGTGVRIFLRAALPPGRRKAGNLEVYETGRYLTVTGQHVPGTPKLIHERTRHLAEWHAEAFPPVEPTPIREPRPPASLRLDDAELVTRASRAQNGAKFAALWAGDTTGYASASEADLALCSLLTFWTGGDAGDVDRLFRASGLYREKWDQRHGTETYGQRTIARAANTAEVYGGSSPALTVPPASRNGTTHTVDPEPGEVLAREWTRPISALFTQEETEVDWLVDQLFSAGSSGFIAAEPKVGKSWVGLELAYCLSTGATFLDRFQIPTPRRVLFIEEEDAERRMVRRFKRLMRGRPERKLPPDSHFRYAVRTGFRLDDATWMAALEEQLRAFPADMVILDVFNKLHLKDENSQPEMSAILHALGALTRTFGCAFIIIHHYRKAGGVGASTRGNQMLRGSGALAGYAECSLYLRKGSDKNKIVATAESKDASEMEDFEIILEDTDADGTRLRADEVSSATAGQLDRETVLEAIRGLMERGQDVTPTIVVDALGWSRSKVSATLNSMVLKGMLDVETVQTGKVRHRFYTPCQRASE